MKLITRDTDYALRALCFIAKEKSKVVAVSELVKQLNVPKPFLRKALQILNKRGVLKSYKGLGGGFSLVKPANKIFLVTIIEIFQGPLRLNECLLKKMACPKKRGCVLRKKIDRIERFMLAQLRPVTIASLLR